MRWPRLLLALLACANPGSAEAFAIGDTVKVFNTNSLNVRICPAGSAIGVQTWNSVGVITGGTGELVNGYRRWEVNFETGADGCVAQDYLQITSPPAPAVTIDSYTATPSTIKPGESAMLAWQTSNTTTVTVNGVAVPVDGTSTVSPMVTTNYDLLAGGSSSGRVTVTVATAAPPEVGSGTWSHVVVQPRTVYQPYLAGNQNLAQGQSGAAITVCPRPIVEDGTIYRSYSPLTGGGGKAISIGGAHAGHPGSDVDIFDVATRTWTLPYVSECPPAYNPDGTPNGTWRAIKTSGGIAVGGFTPNTQAPYAQHLYRNGVVDEPRNRFVILTGNGLQAYALAANAWGLLAGRSRSAGEVGCGSTCGIVIDEGANAIFIFASESNNQAGRGIWRYGLNPDGSVATKGRVREWPVLANWSFASKYITAVRGPGRTAWFMMTPITQTTNNPANRLFSYHFDTNVLTWDQTLVPGQPAYDSLVSVAGGFNRWDRRAATGQLYFWVKPAAPHPAGLWIKTEATNLWTFVPVSGSAPNIATYTFAYAGPTMDKFVGLDFRSNYCAGGACGGVADTWILTP